MSRYKWNEEVNKYSMPELTYDNNGNILTLQRNSIVNTTLGNMDNLTYTYKGNRLLGVNDASNNTEGFNDNGFTDVVIPEQENTHEYSYDNNGNMTQDFNKDVEYIKYNYLNKPYYISFNRSNYITYIYDAAGTKLKKTVHYNGTETSTDYVGDFVYHENTLSFAASEAGRITPQADGSFRNEYIIADHLGNTRTLFTDANSDRIPEILQENHYDPFGMTLGNLSYETPDGNNKYKYNGKELQDDLGLNWYDYGARMYDAAIGRWHVVDPMANKTLRLTPYNYCRNNPVVMIDPDGRYSFFGAKWRNLFWGGKGIYKDNISREWGVELAGMSINQESYQKASGEWVEENIPETVCQTKGSKHMFKEDWEKIVKKAHYSDPYEGHNDQANTGTIYKKEVLQVANGLDIAGKTLTGVALVVAPFVPPAAGVIGSVGQTLSGASDAINLGVDISEGNYGKAAFNATINIVGFGIGKKIDIAKGLTKNDKIILNSINNAQGEAIKTGVDKTIDKNE